MKGFTQWQETELPRKTKSYQPVGHQSLINLINEVLDLHGFKTTTFRVNQSPDGNVINGHIGIERDYGYSDFHQELGFVNSYDKTKPIMVAGGGRVWICENGMVSAEIAQVRKHTKNVWDDIHEQVGMVVAKLDDNWEKLVRETDLMKQVEMTSTQTAELLGRVHFEEGILNTTEVIIANKEIKNPTFGTFKEKTLWSTYNACTYGLKKANVRRQTESLKALHDFCVDYAEDHKLIYG